MNPETRAIDLSLWRISAGGVEFTIPQNTQILAATTVVFPPQVTELTATGPVELLFPSGEVAATYGDAPLAVAQPQSPQIGSQSVQAIAPSISTLSDIAHANTQVNASASTTNLLPFGSLAAGVTGAALATAPLPAVAKSPWTLGFLGLLVISGGAFMIL